MKMMKYFFECYFNMSMDFSDLDDLIQEFKTKESEGLFLQFINELNQIINTKNYGCALQCIQKYGFRDPHIEKVEGIIKFLYDKLLDRPTDVRGVDFIKQCKVVFCPVCCPKPSKAKIVNVIEKATIIANNKQIYVCKPCKLVWFDEENIKANNAQDYKKYMRTLGLKGLWKELTDVDIL